MCSHECIGSAGARSNDIFVRNTFHGVATVPPRQFSLVRYLFPLRTRWFTYFWFSPLYLFPPFSVFPYIRIYVRAFRGPVGACVRLCLREAQPAGTPSAIRARDVRISVLWMWFCFRIVVSLCVVVYAPTGPGASFSETLFSRPWTRTCVCVCVCVCVFLVKCSIPLLNRYAS